SDCPNNWLNDIHRKETVYETDCFIAVRICNGSRRWRRRGPKIYTRRCKTRPSEREGHPRRFTVRRDRERAPTQADRGPPASRGAGAGRLLGPVPSGELAHHTSVRGGRPPSISTCRASAHIILRAKR